MKTNVVTVLRKMRVKCIRCRVIFSTLSFLTRECESNERVIAVGGNFARSLARSLDGL